MQQQDTFGRYALTDFLERMNQLLLNSVEAEDVDASGKKKKKRTDSGMLDVGSLFRFYSREGVKGNYGVNDKKAAIVGISHPSDGHPQEELTPDFGWFRPLSHNNMTWTLWWPELTV